jgi:UDP-N-acetylglucosamine acyltransferase
MRIHSTAIIACEARIADDVRIGPNVVIEGPVEIGPGTVIGPNAVLTGRVQIGAKNKIGPGVVLGAEPQDLSFDPATDSGVWIGDGNTLREYVTIHRATVAGSDTTVGHHNFLMVGVHLGHDVRLGSHCILANNALLAGHVQFGDRVVVGGGSVFHQHIRVGEGVLTQGLTAAGKDIPPFCVASKVNRVNGLNTIGLRRAGRGPEERAELHRAFDLVYRSGLNITQALEKSREREWTGAARTFFEFVVAAQKRGMMAHSPARAAEQ